MKAKTYFLLSLALLVLFPWQVAAAEEVSTEELHRLANRALDNPSILGRLRRITVVDGQPVRLQHALDTDSPEELESRLRSLADSGDSGLPPVTDPRARVGSILKDDRFAPPRTPRPFRGLLDRVGDWIAGWASRLPGGEPTLLLLTAILVLIVAFALGGRIALRRSAFSSSPHGARQRGPEESRVPLETLARQAEERGDFRAAVRLRFGALVARLDAQQHIGYRPSMTSGEVRRLLKSSEFDAAAAFFDEVAYGERLPSKEDVERTRLEWAAL